LGRKQTLKYLKGYANDSEPVMSAGEPREPSRELINSLAFGEPRAASAVGETLPKWVENDRKVRACVRKAGANRALHLSAVGVVF